MTFHNTPLRWGHSQLENDPSRSQTYTAGFFFRASLFDSRLLRMMRNFFQGLHNSSHDCALSNVNGCIAGTHCTCKAAGLVRAEIPDVRCTSAFHGF